MDEKGRGFSKEERLRKRREFLGVYERGDKIQSTYFVLYILENGKSHHRLGITASRKIGRAVVRNRIKRRLREIFRTNKQVIFPHCDMIVNAKRAAARAHNQQIQEDILKGILRWKRKAPPRERGG
ncbi:MAG: ribonuclease P protein component [Nitrososphaerales archaeon]